MELGTSKCSAGNVISIEPPDGTSLETRNSNVKSQVAAIC